MQVAGEGGLDFAERCRRSFLGLALGDAYGRPFEFVSAGVQTMEVRVGEGFRWTDDTHMTLYLAEALLEREPGRLDADAFGELLGRQFSAWRIDPLTPSTAPGRTCLEGVRTWEETGDWRTSGVPDSDGCGAVMRVAPIPMALDGDDLVRAARVSAAITHGHPNALEGAVATCWLVRRCLEEGELRRERIEELAALLRGEWSEGGVVADALDAALAFAGTEAPWLDEPGIPTGDGGWRSASALGLAVAAVLRWGPDFETVIDKSARIAGDSDSVACIAGMILGAAGAALPACWLEHLPERDRMESLAARLAAGPG